MIQRVIGAFAALAIIGTAACSSSTTTTVTKPDAGGDVKTDVLTDTKTETAADTGPAVICAPAAGANTDCTTGAACATNDDCDLTGNGLSHCTGANVYIVGPINPTPICTQFDTTGADACDPGEIDPATGEQTQIVTCDGSKGLCTETPENNKAGAAMCEPFCQLDPTGKFVTSCTGKNACSPKVLGTDTATGKGVLIGTCFGGCSADADCPSGSKCDVLQKICVNVTCKNDAECKTKWSTAPASWKCELAGGATSGFCKFLYAKAVGDLCDPNATNDECLCIAGTGATQGVCGALCKTGNTTDCVNNTVCDPLLNVKDSTGADIYAAGFALPAGMSGICVMKCAADADCKAGQKCELSAGMGTQKTCR